MLSTCSLWFFQCFNIKDPLPTLCCLVFAWDSMGDISRPGVLIFQWVNFFNWIYSTFKNCCQSSSGSRNVRQPNNWILSPYPFVGSMGIALDGMGRGGLLGLYRAIWDYVRSLSIKLEALRQIVPSNLVHLYNIFQGWLEALFGTQHRITRMSACFGGQHEHASCITYPNAMHHAEHLNALHHA